MRYFTLFFFLFLLQSNENVAQTKSSVISQLSFDDSYTFPFNKLDTWYYHAGNNPAWSKEQANLTGWTFRGPTTLSLADADKNGRIEGWFRVTFKLDSTLKNKEEFGIRNEAWAATTIFLNGQYITSFGSTSEAYAEYNPFGKLPRTIRLTPNQTYTLAVHVVDYTAGIPILNTKSESTVTGFQNLLLLTLPEYTTIRSKIIAKRSIDVVVYLSITTAIFLFFVLLAVQNHKEVVFWHFVLLLSMMSVISLFSFLLDNSSLSFTNYNTYFIIRDLISWVWPSTALVIIALLFNNKAPRLLTAPVFFFLLIGMVSSFISRSIFSQRLLFSSFSGILFLGFTIYLYISSRETINKSQRILIITALATASSTLIWYFLPDFEVTGDYLLYLSFPVGLVIYITSRFKDILLEAQRNARNITILAAKNESLLTSQNELLEQQVSDRTNQLNQSLERLKVTQIQLIQKEKLAAMGELTAGIAHEIQNPLNFVNNFSEVSTELVNELETEQQRPTRDPELEAELLGDLKQNIQKINHHGQRASSIVKGMLGHSRVSTGERQPTDLNALADECLRLSYHGLQAKDKGFICKLMTDFAPDLGLVDVVPQDLGRVLFNLFNNAFYAVNQQQKSTTVDYQPTVTVSTKQTAAGVDIRIGDNGTGIPEAVKGKIFQPFFTTKPTGEGTGLGLSLAYDIITKGHGGELKLETQPGAFTEFVITLKRDNQL